MNFIRKCRDASFLFFFGIGGLNLSAMNRQQQVEIAETLAVVGQIATLTTGGASLTFNGLQKLGVIKIPFQPEQQMGGQSFDLPMQLAKENDSSPLQDFLENHDQVVSIADIEVPVKHDISSNTIPENFELGESVIIGDAGFKSELGNQLLADSAAISKDRAKQAVLQNLLPGKLRFEIKPHEMHPAQERFDKMLQQEKVANKQLEEIISCPASKNAQIFNNFLKKIENACLVGFSSPDKNPDILGIEREQARMAILSARWPKELPRGTTQERAFNNLKYDIQQCEYAPGGGPRISKSANEAVEWAKKRADILNKYFEMTCSQNAHKAVINKALHRYNVPYLNEAYQASLNEAQSGWWKSAKMTGRLVKNMGKGVVDFWGHDLWVGQPDLANEIKTNQINKDLDLRRQLFMEGQFKEAFELADKYWNTEHYEHMLEPIKYAFFRINNYDGIPRCCEQDPLWRKEYAANKQEFQEYLPQSEGQRFRYHECDKLHQVQEKLLERHFIKTEISNALGIPSQHSAYIDRILYKVVDCYKGGVVNKPGIFKAVQHLSSDADTQDRRDACQYFFTEAGVCKLIPFDPSVVEGIKIDPCINNANFNEVRQLLNGFLCVDTDMPAAAEFVRQGAEYCVKACEQNELASSYQKLAKAWFAAGVSPEVDKALLSFGDLAVEYDSPELQALHKDIVQLVSQVAEKLYVTHNGDHTELKMLLACGGAAQKLCADGQPISAAFLLDNDYIEELAGKNDILLSHHGSQKVEPCKLPIFDKAEQGSIIRDCFQEHPVEIQEPGAFKDAMEGLVSRKLFLNSSIKDTESMKQLGDLKIPDWMDCCELIETTRELPADFFSEDELKIAEEILESTTNNSDDMFEHVKDVDERLIKGGDEYKEAISSLLSVSQQLYENGLKKAAVELAAMSLKSAEFLYGVGIGAVKGGVGAWRDMAHMLLNPKVTLQNIGEVTGYYLKLAAYTEYVEYMTKYGLATDDFDSLDEVLRGENVPAALLEAKLKLDVLSDHVADEILEFVNNASAKEWGEASGRFVGGFLGWHYNPARTVKYISRATGAGESTFKLVDRWGRSLVQNGLNERLIGHLENFGAPSDLVLDTLKAEKFAGEAECLSKYRNLIEGAARGYAEIEQALSVSSVVENIKSLSASAGPLESYLKEVGELAGKHGFPNNVHPIRFRKDLLKEMASKELKRNIAAKAAEKIMYQAYDTAIARSKAGYEITRLPDLAREIGVRNLEILKSGGKIDLGRYNLIPKDRALIEKALDTLQHVDDVLGKDGPLTRFIKCGVEGDLGNAGLHGPLYEIREAIEIEKICPNVVKRFNVTQECLKEIFGAKAFKDAGGKKIEFDIMTVDSLVECKNVDWQSTLKKGGVGGFIKKMNDHKDIALSLGMKYQLRSAHLMPRDLKSLLGKNGIEFVERNCEKCNNCLLK